jgi:phosphinothricin acetyltransferase
MSAAPYAIVDAEESDLPDILAIYNQVIATTTAVYSNIPATLDDRLAWMRARREKGFPVLVVRDAGSSPASSRVAGFASFGEFRSWPGYRHTVEHSVHIREDARGRGLGGALVAELVERARALHMHVMIGGVDAANEASIRMHEKLGFERAAVLRQVGRKFERWLDLCFVQKVLREG